MTGTRAAVYIRLQQDGNPDCVRTLLHIYGPTVTLGDIQQEAEKSCDYGEVLDEIEIHFEDRADRPKAKDRAEQEKEK